LRVVASLVLGVQRIPDWWLTERQYEVGDEEVAMHTERFTAAFQWDAVARVTRFRDAIVVHLAGTHGYVDLPTAAMSDEQQAAVTALLAERGLIERR
jgi:hypothetical protein